MSFDTKSFDDLNAYDFMETDVPEWIRSDPNLNVTSVPEQLDVATESSFSSDQGTPLVVVHSEEPNATMTELTTVEQGNEATVDPMFSFFNSDAQEGCQTPDWPAASVGCEFTFGALTTYRHPGPATVTLVKSPQHNDPLTSKLLQELYTDDSDTIGSEKSCGLKDFGKHTAPLFRLSQPPTDATVNVPNLPLFEPRLALKPEVQTPAFDLMSPTDSMDTGFTYASSTEDTASVGVAMSLDRKAEIDRKAAYIREVIEKRNDKPDDMSSKLKVHEVILVILLNAAHGDKSKDLQRILTFCDENGRETSGDYRHFKTLDTETMGLLWQKIKRNKKGNYDTFARAMRVRRERSEGFFDYLDAGKGKKKRIYRFGGRSMEEMARFRKTLRQMSKPQTCSY